MALFDLFSAKRRRTLLPWESGFAGTVLLCKFASGWAWVQEWAVDAGHKDGRKVYRCSSWFARSKAVDCRNTGKMGTPILQDQRFGTHSCKSTLLSWLAKAGSDLAHRTQVGYHSSEAAETALLYSRDALASHLRTLHEVLLHVRAGRFNPDVTRSGRWMIQDVDELDHAVEGSVYEEPESKHHCDSNFNASSSSDHSYAFAETLSSEFPPLLEPRPKVAAVKKLYVGIDFEGVSDVKSVRSSCSERDKPQSGDCLWEDEDEVPLEASPVTERFNFKGCSLTHNSTRTIFDCSECLTAGCSHCMPVSIISGRLVCLCCKIGLDDVFNSLEGGFNFEQSESSDSEASSTNSDREEACVEVATEIVSVRVEGRSAAKNADDEIYQKVSRILHFLKAVR
jgi:hypothetical protein